MNSTAALGGGVGVILAEECQHGVQGDWHTMMPSPVTLAAAFDRDLMEQVGVVGGTALAARAQVAAVGKALGRAEGAWVDAQEEARRAGEAVARWAELLETAKQG